MENNNTYLDEINAIFETVKSNMTEKLSETTVKLWFGELKITDFQNDVVHVECFSELKFDIIREKYLDLLTEQFSKLLGFPVQIHLYLAAGKKNVNTAANTPDKEENSNLNEFTLFTDFQPAYNFDNFIVGSTNNFAYASCINIATHEPKEARYNPLFIYGHSGLGKTHLLHATINRMHQLFPLTKIIYVKGEEFTNQMIACIAEKNMDSFREKFRKCDVLLIDDIQFIAGKNMAQEEFFHTFNALYEAKKLIIMTSDRPPKDIPLLQDRLLTRFEWGLLADIEPPDEELRTAIIKSKADQIGIHLQDAVLNYLGENLRFNVRQIEGAIKKLGALSFLNGGEITLEMAKSCVSELIPDKPNDEELTERIFKTIENRYQITKEEIVGNKRTKDVAAARHLTAYFLRTMTDLSLTAIGKILNRDHSTILSSLSMIEEKQKESLTFASEIHDLKDDILT